MGDGWYPLLFTGFQMFVLFVTMHFKAEQTQCYNIVSLICGVVCDWRTAVTIDGNDIKGAGNDIEPSSPYVHFLSWELY